MTAKEIREKSNTEILAEIEALKDELFNLRFQRSCLITKQESNVVANNV